MEAGCNAHGRRKLRDAETVQPALAEEDGAFVSAIYVHEAEAQKLGLTGDALRTWRQDKVPPLHAEQLRCMEAVEATLTPASAGQDDPLLPKPLGRAVRFVDHPEIFIDDSASEREFQHVAKLRLNSPFAGSTEGAHRAATLLGITATCRSIGVDPRGYLGWILTRLGTYRDVFALSASEITPAAYARDG